MADPITDHGGSGMGEQETRRWTIRGPLMGGYAFLAEGSSLSAGESVEVIPAVLTEETFGRVVKAAAKARYVLPWSALNDEAQADLSRIVLAALSEAGFSPVQGPSEGDQ